MRLAGTDLSIAGRVRDQRGRPVAGIEVSAVRHRFASATNEGAAEASPARATRTRPDGSFVIRGLVEGEYEVQTRATDRHASAKVTVQAGNSSVELILLKGLRARRDRFVHTDDEGSYGLELDLCSEDRDLTLRFCLQGYEEEFLALPRGAPDGRRVRLDAQLRVSSLRRTHAGARGDPPAGRDAGHPRVPGAALSSRTDQRAPPQQHQGRASWETDFEARV